jgi:DNA invertase Pin-like site-specific DNA recombinase
MSKLIFPPVTPEGLYTQDKRRMDWDEFERRMVRERYRRVQITERRAQVALERRLANVARVAMVTTLNNEGVSNANIARLLGISENSVREVLKP